MRFEKVSKKQYLKDAIGDSKSTKFTDINVKDIGALTEEDFENYYGDIKLPVRATKKSAGYDFFAPYNITLWPGDSIRVATGIRVLLDDDKFLMCVPRSGLGFKYRVQLDNTVGIIDADYSDSANEGHIMFKLTCDSKSNKPMNIKKGDGMVQGIIVQYFKVDNDESYNARNGGFGSTNKEDK